MFKFILKLFAFAAAIFAALIGFAYWSKSQENEYIEIYSDEEDDTF